MTARLIACIAFLSACDGTLPPTDDAGLIEDAGAGDAGVIDRDGGMIDAGGDAGTSGCTASACAESWMAGTNLAGADFGESNLPGVYDTDYVYPNEGEVDYFVGRGMTVFRVPFRWERLQRTLRADFDATEQGRLESIVRYATGQGARVILDPHNYARYHDDLVGSGAVSNDDFADFWRRLALVFADDDRVIFGLVNEPNTMPTEQWLAAANAAIAAIRAAGVRNLIMVPGNAWTGAFSWEQSWYGTPNADVMTGVVDPMNRYAIEVHQYLDGDSSGRSGDCVSTTIGSERVAAFTAWLRDNGVQGFLGELGGGANATCEAAVHDLLDYLEANADVWLGWTWWAAGPWWGNYMFSIEPRTDGSDATQMTWLADHL